MAPTSIRINTQEMDPISEIRSQESDVPPARNPKIGSRLCARIFSHGTLSWVTLQLAFAFFVLTTLHAWHPDIMSKTYFGKSPNRALAVLTTLSMFANYMLSATISQSSDIVHGMLIARRGGHRLIDDLPLHSGTGLDGHWNIFFKTPWTPWSNWKPRAWTTFRVLSMIVVPAIGIALLSNVQPIPIYHQTTSVSVAQGYGIGEFNSSLAPLLQPLADPLFGSTFKDFLSDADRTIDVSNFTNRMGCLDLQKGKTGAVCHSQYFVPGGIEQFAPRLFASGNFTSGSDIQPVIVRNLRGYYFEYRSSESIVFDQELDCIRQGYPLAAYELCMKGVASGGVATYITPCPKSLAANLSCLSSYTWPLSTGWSTTLTTSTRTADVVYNSLNGTILTHSFLPSPPKPVNITATELLQIFTTLFSPTIQNTTFSSALQALGIKTNKPVIPFTVWQYFQGLSDLSAHSPHANMRATLGLQSLLAIPIYHLQAKDFAELRVLLLNQIDDSSDVVQTLGKDIVNLFPVVKTDTDIFPAVLRYTLLVGRKSLLAYLILASFTLALCFFANLLGSILDVGSYCRGMGAFPFLDQICEWKVECKGGDGKWRDEEVGRVDFKGLSEKEKLMKMSEMRLMLWEEKEKQEPLKVARQEESVLVKDKASIPLGMV